MIGSWAYVRLICCNQGRVVLACERRLTSGCRLSPPKNTVCELEPRQQQITLPVQMERKDKVKRLSLVSDIEKGGLKAPHVESIIICQRIMCCKNFPDDQKINWKIVLSHYLKNVLGLKLLLRCAFD